MMIYNLTKEDVKIIGKGYVTIIGMCGATVHVEKESVIIGCINGINITQNLYKNIIGLPSPQSDTYYIVEPIVKEAMPLRTDLLVPDIPVRFGGFKSLRL